MRIFFLFATSGYNLMGVWMEMQYERTAQSPSASFERTLDIARETYPMRACCAMDTLAG